MRTDWTASRARGASPHGGRFSAYWRCISRQRASSGRFRLPWLPGLLCVHVIQTWYARYPNSEIVTQALVFAALLAHAYAHEDDDGFFGPVAASLLGLALFTRLPVVLVVGVAIAASLLPQVKGRRGRVTFLVTLAAWSVAAGAYYATQLGPYMGRPISYAQSLQPIHLLLLAAGATGVAGVVMGQQETECVGSDANSCAGCADRDRRDRRDLRSVFPRARSRPGAARCACRAYLRKPVFHVDCVWACTRGLCAAGVAIVLAGARARPGDHRDDDGLLLQDEDLARTLLACAPFPHGNPARRADLRIGGHVRAALDEGIMA